MSVLVGLVLVAIVVIVCLPIAMLAALFVTLFVFELIDYLASFARALRADWRAALYRVARDFAEVAALFYGGFAYEADNLAEAFGLQRTRTTREGRWLE